MEVLTAYARENAPFQDSTKEVPKTSSVSDEEAKEQEAALDELQKPSSPQALWADIRAIGDVIRRLQGGDGVPEEYLVYFLDLDETDLQGAYLIRANLSRADLRRARNVTQEQLKQARGNKDTELPEGLEYPVQWGSVTDE